MDVKPTTKVASPDLAQEAESLLRCLAGVTHVRVVAGPRGLDAIHVVAADRHTAPGLAGKVRSALLAGLAAPVLPTRIHVRVDDEDEDDRPARPDAGPAPPAHRLRLLDDREGRAQATPDRLAGQEDPARTMDPAGHEPGEVHPIALPRLVAVDLDRRDDGRILCRVSVAFRTRVFVDEALAVDLPGAAAHAAAQAAVRALVRAGIDGLELEGLREVEIAGREYALVALRRTDSSRRVRSGSVPFTGAAERAAALAAVTAARELL